MNAQKKHLIMRKLENVRNVMILAKIVQNPQ
jgi:hypothetical protein